MSMSGGCRTLLAGIALAASLALLACGGEGDDDDAALTATPSVTTTVVGPVGTSTPPAPINEFKVAFINLYSPLTLDRNDQVASQTFDARIAQLAEELRELDPDVIAFNEASVTEHGNAIERLVGELELEYAWGQANPGFGADPDAADAAAKQQGFREGELLFSRYPILSSERILLNPRSSELGEGRIALFARIKAPAPLGELNVVVTHLTGGGESIRRAQATDLVSKLKDMTADRPTLLIGDIGEPVESATYEVFRKAGFSDPGWEQQLPTCCRQSVLGEQPELTARHDCIMSQGFAGGSMQLFAEHPATQPDGQSLYASDHNGLFAVFALEGGRPEG